MRYFVVTFQLTSHENSDRFCVKMIIEFHVHRCVTVKMHRSYVSDYKPCNASEFQCTNGKCIPYEKRCNGGEPDCYDRSDEIGCGGFIIVPHREKTGFSPMRKQRRRSALQ